MSKPQQRGYRTCIACAPLMGSQRAVRGKPPVSPACSPPKRGDSHSSGKRTRISFQNGLGGTTCHILAWGGVASVMYHPRSGRAALALLRLQQELEPLEIRFGLVLELARKERSCHLKEPTRFYLEGSAESRAGARGLKAVGDLQRGGAGAALEAEGAVRLQRGDLAGGFQLHAE